LIKTQLFYINRTFFLKTDTRALSYC